MPGIKHTEERDAGGYDEITCPSYPRLRMMKGIELWANLVDEILDESHCDEDDDEFLKHPEVHVLLRKYSLDYCQSIADGWHSEENPEQVDEAEGNQDLNQSDASSLPSYL